MGYPVICMLYFWSLLALMRSLWWSLTHRFFTLEIGTTLCPNGPINRWFLGNTNTTKANFKSRADHFMISCVRVVFLTNAKVQILWLMLRAGLPNFLPLARILDIHVAFFKPFCSIPFFFPNFCLWLCFQAKAGDRTIGSIVCKAERELEEEPYTGYIAMLAVDTAYRKHGIGQILFDRMNGARKSVCLCSVGFNLVH